MWCMGVIQVRRLSFLVLMTPFWVTVISIYYIVWPQRLSEAFFLLAVEHVELPRCLVRPSGCSPERMTTAESAGFQLATWKHEQTQRRIHLLMSKLINKQLVLLWLTYLVLIKHMMVFNRKMLLVPCCWSCSSSVLDLSGQPSDSRSLWKLMARLSQYHGW